MEVLVFNTDVTTGACKYSLTDNTDKHTGASKVITQVWSSWKRLACLGVDEYAGKRCNHLAKEIAGKGSLSEGSIGGQGQIGHFHYGNTLWK